MKFFKYASSAIITFLCAMVAAILVNLIGSEANSMVAAAITGGVCVAVSTACSFVLGKVKQAKMYTSENGAQLVTMLIVGVLSGILGGVMMTF